MKNLNFYPGAVALAMGLAFLPVVGTFASVTPAYAAEEIRPRINVTGEGVVYLAPDIATLQLGVLSEADTARDALSSNNKQMAAVIASMKEGGIAEKDLQTSGFSIQPRYVYDNPKQGEEQKPPRIVGYTVSNNLSVKIRDLKKVGEVLDRSVTLGINNGGNIQFGNDDPGEAISKARASAMKDAKDRAEVLLSAAGAKLGKIIEINESFSRPHPVPMAMERKMVGAAMADSVPIEGGENSYTINVSVSWEIVQ